jgi:hypothetical protein
MSIKNTLRKPSGTLCHVISVTDSGVGDGNVVTYRWWSKNKQFWVYDAELEIIVNEFWTAKRGGK